MGQLLVIKALYTKSPVNRPDLSCIPALTYILSKVANRV